MNSCVKVAALATVLGFLCCTTAAQSYINAEPQPTQVSNQMLVSTEWLAEHLSDADVLVLCVAGAPGFYSRGHIPGARLLNFNDIVVTSNGVPNQLPPAEQLKKAFEAAGASDLTRIVLYGERSGLLAAHAYWTLDYLGVADHAALLDGGVEKWQSEGRPLSQESAQITAGHLSVFPNPSVMISAAELEKLLKSPPNTVTLLDARPDSEFTGEKLSEEATAAGHLPGARSLYWKRNIESSENPILRRDSELRTMYEELGASAERPLITYCRTGIQSSFDYFVAKYLGYKAQMYSGSFLDWTKRGLPVERQQGTAQH